MRCFKKVFIYKAILFVLLGLCSLSYGQNHIYFTKNAASPDILENYHIRQKYRKLFFSSVYHIMNAKDRIYIQDNYSHNVEVQQVVKENALFFLFLNEQNAGYPMVGRGNVSIKKSKKNGDILQMIMMIRDNNGCYIRFVPEKERTALDVYLFGTRLYHHVIVPISLTELIFESFGSIVDLTENILDWDQILYNTKGEESEKGLEIFHTIQKLLPSLHTVDDGALSGDGKYIFIKSHELQNLKGGFNCSGFAKWIVDGFYFPLTGKYIDIGLLKEKHLDYRGNRWSLWYEDERDPYFGLDWTRNLALILYNEQHKKQIMNPEFADIRDIPFLKYIEDVGYPLDDMELVLYFLAIQNPDYFYLGSVNQTIGTNPPLQQHYHIAVLFPYFTPDNRFKTIIMEKNKQTTLSAFKKEHGNANIHLVKVKITGGFELPVLP